MYLSQLMYCTKTSRLKSSSMTCLTSHKLNLSVVVTEHNITRLEPH